MKKDSILFGALLGTFIPIVGWALFLYLNDFIASDADLLKTKSGFRFSERLITLLAICLNLIPATIFNKRNWVQGLRGVVFPTFVGMVLWIIKFIPELFAD